MKPKPRSRVIAAFVVIALALTTACTQQPGAAPDVQLKTQQNPNSPMEQIRMQQAPSSDYRALGGAEERALPIVTINGVKYVSARALIDTLQFKSDWNPDTQTMQVGDNDAEYELKMNSTRARKEDDEVILANPPIQQGDMAYLPVHAVADLFKEDMSYDLEDSRMVIHPTAESLVDTIDENNPGSPDLDFADDPEDPFKGGDQAEQPTMSPLQPDAASLTSEAVPVIKNVDLNAVIRKAHQYLGVKYLFGTGPYPQTGRFDCSTFTRYVYGKYGVQLSRTARAQSRQGVLVSRKSLRKGDLLFFYVPGRFKSNKIVGHVGIYMGNGKMINASPAPKNGVQISPINNAYWKKTFLRAKRVAY